MEASEKIRSRSRRDSSKGCLTWTGTKTKSHPRATPYGIIYVKPPFSSRRRKFRVHQIVYMAAHSQTNYGPNGVNYDNFDISHLCHNSLCVEASHLSREPRSVNNHRKTCKEEGRCYGGHGDYPACIFSEITQISSEQVIRYSIHS